MNKRNKSVGVRVVRLIFDRFLVALSFLALFSKSIFVLSQNSVILVFRVFRTLSGPVGKI